MSIFLAILMICPLISLILAQTQLCGMGLELYLMYFGPYVLLYTAMLIYLYWGLSLHIVIVTIQETLFMVPIFLRILMVFFLKSLGIFQISWKTTPKGSRKNAYYGHILPLITPYAMYVIMGLYLIIAYSNHKNDTWWVDTLWITFMIFQIIPVPAYLLQNAILG